MCLCSTRTTEFSEEHPLSGVEPASILVPVKHKGRDGGPRVGGYA
jgi:hypothetical protein